jgi:hypothetical protein
MKPKVKGKVARLVITRQQRDTLREYETNTTTGGGYQSLCGRVAHAAREQPDGTLVTLVHGEDMERIRTAANKQHAGDTGGWQHLFKEILEQQR